MDLGSKIIFIIIYLICMIVFYVFMIKRLGYLHKKHIDYTNIQELDRNYKPLLFNVSIAWFFAVVLSIILITRI